MSNNQPWVKGISLLLILLFNIHSFAQEMNDNPSRNEVWTGVSLSKKLNKKVGLNLDQQTRFTDGLSTFRVSFFELGTTYKFNEHFNFKSQARYSFRSESRNTFRLSFDGKAKYKIKSLNLNLVYRLRLQNSTVDYTAQNITLLRNRFGLSYDWTKKLDSYLQYESFYRLNEPMEFRANRYSLGMNWEVRKNLALDFFIQIDHEINRKNPWTEYIVGTLLEVKL